MPPEGLQNQKGTHDQWCDGQGTLAGILTEFGSSLCALLRQVFAASWWGKSIDRESEQKSYLILIMRSFVQRRLEVWASAKDALLNYPCIGQNKSIFDNTVELTIR